MVASTIFEKSSSGQKRVPIFDQKIVAQNKATGQIIFNRELRQKFCTHWAVVVVPASTR